MKHDLETGKGRWAKTVDRYRQEIGLSWNDMIEINKKDIKNKVKDRDTRIWREKMEEKETLKWYRKGKEKIQYDQCYRNGLSSKLLARARTNTLKLEEVIYRINREYNKTCKLCGAEEEDLRHFILECPRLEGKRDRRLMEKWRNVDKDKQLINILFKEKDHNKLRQMLGAMWQYRKDLLRPP